MIVAALLGVAMALAAAAALGMRRAAAGGVLLIAAIGVGVGANAARVDRECLARQRTPFLCRVQYEPPAALAPWRDRAGAAKQAREALALRPYDSEAKTILDMANNGFVASPAARGRAAPAKLPLAISEEDAVTPQRETAGAALSRRLQFPILRN